MIHIKVNDAPKKIAETTTLEEIIKELDISVNGIAVAVNENIVSKATWGNKTLTENDEVLIIKATQGG